MRFMWAIILSLISGCVMHPVSYMGDEYRGTRYLKSPLGEGVLPDADPLIRFDAFDCTTFVETILADGDVDTLNKIRYQNGEIGFLTRNHFIESDWLVNNSNRVENVSSDYGKTAVRHVVIDKSAWMKRVHNIDAEFVPTAVDLEYIPYKYLTEIDNKDVLIVLFVTDNPKMRDNIGTDLAVVHMGLLLPDGTLRHASSVGGMVVDVSFMDYVHTRRQNDNHIGITLVKIK